MQKKEELWIAQAALEGICQDLGGHLRRFKDMPGESGSPPRIAAVDYGDCQRLCFGACMDPEIEALLRVLPFRDVFSGEKEVFRLLGVPDGAGIRAEYWTYTLGSTDSVAASSLPHKLSSQDERLRDLPGGFFGIPYEHVFAAIVDGAVAAASASSREDGTSAELWTFTRPEHRRRGLGRNVALSWLRDVQDRGLIPFYSHVAENLPSRRLAESLPLVLAFVQACYQ